MNTQQSSETIRNDFIEKILQCYEGTLPIEKLISFAEPLKNNPDLTNDPSFQDCFDRLDYLSKQLVSGNKDLLSPKKIKESCAYMLGKLTPSRPYIS